MTQIQAYEDMSKEALLEHHLHTLQQHADDMDMLSKELASRTFTVPEGYVLVPIEATKEMKLAFHKANDEFYAGTNYDICSPSHQWAAMLAAAPAAPVAAQAQWIDHCNITDIPDAVLTPSGLAIKSEQVDHIRDATKMVARRTGPVVKDSLTAESPYSLSDTDRTELAGAMGLLAGHGYKGSAAAIRRVLDNAPVAAQAADLLHDSKTLADWLAEAPSSWDEEYRSLWAKLQVAEEKAMQYRKRWMSAMAERVAGDQFTTCSCPSGGGSLRPWPCPVHPPESVAKEPAMDAD